MLDFSTLLGALATVSSVLVYLAPWRQVTEMRVTGKTEQQPFFTFISMLINCFFWSYYGIIAEDSVVFSTTFFGELVAIYYIHTYYTFSKDKRSVELQVVVSMFIMYIVYCYVSHSVPQEQALTQLGILACFASLVMLGSPLLKVVQVGNIFRQKNGDSIPVAMTITAALSNFIWFVYGSMQRDKFIMIPNGLGFFFTALQLLIIITLNKNTGTIIDGDLGIGEIAFKKNQGMSFKLSDIVPIPLQSSFKTIWNLKRNNTHGKDHDADAPTQTLNRNEFIKVRNKEVFQV